MRRSDTKLAKCWSEFHSSAEEVDNIVENRNLIHLSLLGQKIAEKKYVVEDDNLDTLNPIETMLENEIFDQNGGIANN